MRWLILTFTTISVVSLADFRVYLLPDDPYAPVEIKYLNVHEKAENFMLDPSLLSKKGKEKVRRIKVAKLAKSKDSSLKFKSLKVNGRIDNPRVRFELNKLPVRRADQPLPKNFYDKIFTTAPGQL